MGFRDDEIAITLDMLSLRYAPPIAERKGFCSDDGADAAQRRVAGRPRTSRQKWPAYCCPLLPP